MDLRKWCTFWFINVFFVLVIDKVTVVANVCTPGLRMPGYTVPQGDITIKYHDPLDIICILNNATAMRIGPNASEKLSYSRNGKGIPQEMIEIINSTAIKLHVNDPPLASSDNYMCLLNNSNVCMNLVSVGTPPKPVTDFKCIGYNYDNLTCTWTPPNNYLKTEYNLTYILKGRASRFVYPCPDMKYPNPNNDNDTTMSCFWNVSTSPQYRQVHNEFHFTLTMRNPLGTNQINRTFEHFKHVLSGPPENLTVISTTPTSIYLYWMVPHSMQSFPPGVAHRVLFQCVYMGKEWRFGGFITDQIKGGEIKFNLTGLEYAHDWCDIRVSIRSMVALASDESMWSRNASVTVRTGSKIPDEPPKTDAGSFEIVSSGNNLQFREVYVYWRQIREEQKNGENFTYIVSVDGNDSIVPKVYSAYAKFENLSISQSYKFNIWSKNSVGRSSEKSTVVIPKQTQRVKEPVSFTKVELKEGEYELTWSHPRRLLPYQEITNYTIFWCSNDKERPYQCNGKLDWVVVPRDKKDLNVSVSKTEIHQFAISANTDDSSSGMLWAACTIIHNKNMGKMKNVWINRLGSTYIEVGWKLDCSDRIDSVEGFIIYYCPILSPLQTECKGPQKNITFYGDASVLGGNITNLTPYTTYMLTVAVINKHTTYSQQSDPLFNTTLEAAPGSPPYDIELTDVTNSTISLIWKPPNATNGILKYYTVQYHNQTENHTKKIDPHNSFTLTQLTSFSNYTISIMACTTMCSNQSEVLQVTTLMGYPSKIKQPIVTFQNDSYIIILWDRPAEPRGRNEYYQVQIRHKSGTAPDRSASLFNVTSRKYTIEHCSENEKYNSFYMTVRAVNLINNIPFEGPWSDELEAYCRATSNYITYILIGIFVLFVAGMVYLFKKLYKHFMLMRDVEVKLPPGLAPVLGNDQLVAWSNEKIPEDHDRHSPADEEYLLKRMNEEKRHLSGDSSGCSSGHESVASSMEVGTHISSTSDSGTEQPMNYCVLVVDPSTKNAQEIAADSDSAYVPVAPPVIDATSKDVPPYISCEVSSESSSPYVMAGEVVKTMNPGYIPFSVQPESLGKSSGYVVAAIKSNGYIPFNQTDTNKNSGYVVAGIKNCKLD